MFYVLFEVPEVGVHGRWLVRGAERLNRDKLWMKGMVSWVCPLQNVDE